MMVSQQVISYENRTYDVERTPGGHLITVSEENDCWIGIYRLETSLLLAARCRGKPPNRLPVPPYVRAALLEIMAVPP